MLLTRCHLPCFLRHGFLLTWNLSNRLDWPVSIRDHCSRVPRAEPTNLCHHMAFLCGYLVLNSDLHAPAASPSLTELSLPVSPFKTQTGRLQARGDFDKLLKTVTG